MKQRAVSFPEAGIPINVGCVVCNVETALNIYKAANGQSVTEKYITLAGDIPNHVTVKVPVGTPILDVLKLSGIENFEDYAVIDGGPMMGPLLTDYSGYITKKEQRVYHSSQGSSADSEEELHYGSSPAGQPLRL